MQNKKERAKIVRNIGRRNDTNLDRRSRQMLKIKDKIQNMQNDIILTKNKKNNKISMKEKRRGDGLC